MTIEPHGFGPELGRKPITYTCRCGYRNTDYGVVVDHITDENTIAHTASAHHGHRCRRGADERDRNCGDAVRRRA